MHYTEQSYNLNPFFLFVQQAIGFRIQLLLAETTSNIGVEMDKALFVESDFQSCRFQAKDWDYLNEGEEHYVLSYGGKENCLLGKVLIVHKEDKKYSSPKQKEQLPSQKCLSMTYNSIIGAYGRLRPFLLKKTFVKIDDGLKFPFLEEVQANIQDKRTKHRINRLINKSSGMFIAPNLYYQSKCSRIKQTIWVEFKPKSNIQDKYTYSSVEKLAKKYGFQVESLIQIIQKSPCSQKIKWYKKTLGLFNLQENNKISPYELFKYNGAGYIGNSRLTKLQPEGSDMPVSRQEIDKAINSVLRRSNIFRMILIMQLLYDKPSELLKNKGFTCSTKELQSHLKIVQDRLIEQLVQKQINYKEGSHLAGRQVVKTDLGQDLVQQMFRFLVMVTWRDISVVVKISLIDKKDEHLIAEDEASAKFKERVNQDYFSEIELTIIDYELKSMSRIAGNVGKDQKLAQAYVISKLGAEQHRIMNNDQPIRGGIAPGQ